MKSCLLPGFSSRWLVILTFYLDKYMAHYFIYSLPVSINALFACYMPLLTIQVIVFNILNQARSRFRKDVAVLRRTQNFLSSDIPLTNIICPPTSLHHTSDILLPINMTATLKKSKKSATLVFFSHLLFLV